MQFKLLLVPIFLNYCICTAYNVHSVHTYLYGLLALRLFSLFAPLFILCVHFSDYYCFWWLSNWNWFHLHLFVEHITYTHSYNKILCACISFLSTIKKKSNKPVACVQFVHHTHRTFSNIEEWTAVGWRYHIYTFDCSIRTWKSINGNIWLRLCLLQ